MDMRSIKLEIQECFSSLRSIVVAERRGGNVCVCVWGGGGQAAKQTM